MVSRMAAATGRTTESLRDGSPCACVRCRQGRRGKSALAMTVIQRIFALYRDREYFRQLFKIAIPIAMQNFITASLNMIGVIMLGQLGEVSLAAAGLANQVFFLFGIASGAAIFTAQL